MSADVSVRSVQTNELGWRAIRTRGRSVAPLVSPFFRVSKGRREVVGFRRGIRRSSGRSIKLKISSLISGEISCDKNEVVGTSGLRLPPFYPSMYVAVSSFLFRVIKPAEGTLLIGPQFGKTAVPE